MTAQRKHAQFVDTPQHGDRTARGSYVSHDRREAEKRAWHTYDIEVVPQLERRQHDLHVGSAWERRHGHEETESCAVHCTTQPHVHPHRAGIALGFDQMRVVQSINRPTLWLHVTSHRRVCVPRSVGHSCLLDAVAVDPRHEVQ